MTQNAGKDSTGTEGEREIKKMGYFACYCLECGHNECKREYDKEQGAFFTCCDCGASWSYQSKPPAPAPAEAPPMGPTLEVLAEVAPAPAPAEETTRCWHCGRDGQPIRARDGVCLDCAATMPILEPDRPSSDSQALEKRVVEAAIEYIWHHMRGAKVTQILNGSHGERSRQLFLKLVESVDALNAARKGGRS